MDQQTWQRFKNTTQSLIANRQKNLITHAHTIMTKGGQGEVFFPSLQTSPNVLRFPLHYKIIEPWEWFIKDVYTAHLQIVMRHSAAALRHILLWAGHGREMAPNSSAMSPHLTRSSTAEGLRRRRERTERNSFSKDWRWRVSGESGRVQ